MRIKDAFNLNRGSFYEEMHLGCNVRSNTVIWTNSHGNARSNGPFACYVIPNEAGQLKMILCVNDQINSFYSVIFQVIMFQPN